jgi:hypothetical protein
MRDIEIIALRPQLPLDNTQSTPIETFQNETLRPILKLQHTLIIAVFKDYITLRKNAFYQMIETQKMHFIEQAIKTDLKFKNRLLGIVIGHFTEAEYHFFKEHDSELTRRITDLIVQRVQSAF